MLCASLAAACFLCGCRTSLPAEDGIVSPEPTPALPFSAAESPDESPIVVGAVAGAAPDVAAAGHLLSLPERKGWTARDIAGPGVAEPATSGKSPEEVLPVQLNLDSCPLAEVVPLFADLLKFSYVLDPAIGGSAVTATVDTGMTARETWVMFEQILRFGGALAARDGELIHILPFEKMPRQRTLSITAANANGVGVELIPVFHAESAQLAALLTPFLSQGATLMDIPRLNTLLAVDSPSNIPKLRELAAAFDAEGEAAWPQIAVPCREVDAGTVRAELETLLPVLGLPATNSTPSGGRIKLTALPRLGVIVASAAVPEVLREIREWIRILDRQDAAEQENLYFYNVRHSTAAHLAEALAVFFTDIRTTSRLRSSDTVGVSAKAAPPSGTAAPAMVPLLPDNDTASVFETPLVIYADGEQNRLTMRTTARVYRMAEALLRRLDTPPRQVMIQAVVADITLTESTEFGFSYAAFHKYKDYLIKHSLIGAVGTETTNFPDPKAFTDGAALLLRKSDDQLAFIRAVAGRNNVKVLSAPQIMATNDQEAVINVGDRVPIITGDYTDVDAASGGAGTIHRDIQYTDTGVILTVTPHITAGNEVRLDIVQEVSDAVKTQSSGIDSPTIRNRMLSTTLVVPDGGTALLGGLIRTKNSADQTGMPLLMRIPWLGALFRSNSTDSSRTELLVLLAVNVVDGSTALESLAHRYREALAEIQEKTGL
jgi:general secretion pathway protein D